MTDDDSRPIDRLFDESPETTHDESRPIDELFEGAEVEKETPAEQEG